MDELKKRLASRDLVVETGWLVAGRTLASDASSAPKLREAVTQALDLRPEVGDRLTWAVLLEAVGDIDSPMRADRRRPLAAARHLLCRVNYPDSAKADIPDVGLSQMNLITLWRWNEVDATFGSFAPAEAVGQRRVLAALAGRFGFTRTTLAPNDDGTKAIGVVARSLLAQMAEVITDSERLAGLLQDALEATKSADGGASRPQRSGNDFPAAPELKHASAADKPAVGGTPTVTESAVLRSDPEGVLNEPDTVDPEPTAVTQIARLKRPVMFVAGLVALIAVVLAVVIGDYWPVKSPTTENPAGARPTLGADDNWQADWGPDRKVFSVRHPPSYTVLNSFTDNPEVGDERNFVRIKPVGGTNAEYTDLVRGDAGSEFVVYSYIQNDAGDSLGEGASVNGLAAELYLPGPGDDLSVGVTYSGYNAAAVWDGASVVTPTEAQLAYVPGSAVFHSASAPGGTYRPTDEGFSDGKKMPLGYKAPDGYLPIGVTPDGDLIGTGYLTFRVRVEPVDDPGQTSTSSPSATDPSAQTTSPSEPSPSSADDSYYEAGWGPRRAMFTMRSGGSTYPTFNSMSDNPNVGDERNFVGLRDAALTDGYWSDDVWAEPGDTFLMRTFVNNSGSDMADVMPAGRIQGARLSIGISEGEREFSVYSVLEAVNAASVWDGSRLHVDDGVTVTFVPGSVVLETNAYPEEGRVLGDDVFDDGIELGYRRMNGVIRPGYKYSMYVTLKLRVSRSSPSVEVS